MKENKTSDFTTTILVDQTPQEAFNAINNVRGWWTGEPGAEGNTDKLGDEFTYRYKDIHYSKQKITELIPGKRIVWLVTDSKLNFTRDKSEWTGTKISFEIAGRGDKTEIRFTHIGLAPDIECYSDCSNAWSSYINSSLQNFITKDKVKSE
jgi:Activator of Hsp90 ATPase homolog 1-like protein